MDPEVEYAYAIFGAKSIEDAAPLFLQNPMERAAELRFTPPGVFNYYIFCFVQCLLGSVGAGQADMASCFLRLVRDRAEAQAPTLSAVWDHLGPAVSQVASRQAFYAADVGIYGSFPDLLLEIQASMQRSNERGA